MLLKEVLVVFTFWTETDCTAMPDCCLEAILKSEEPSYPKSFYFLLQPLISLVYSLTSTFSYIICFEDASLTISSPFLRF